jgi:hypothetical protein
MNFINANCMKAFRSIGALVLEWAEELRAVRTNFRTASLGRVLGARTVAWSSRASRKSMLMLFGAFALGLVLLERHAMADDWYSTGSGVRTKTIVFVPIKLYIIRHEMRGTPPPKNKRAIIAADQDKRFVWRFLRDVPCDKMRTALRERFEVNGFRDKAKIDAFVGTCSGAYAKDGSTVTVRYDSAAKTTTISMEGLGSATLQGLDSMKAVWGLWFGNGDQPELGDQLMAKIP